MSNCSPELILDYLNRARVRCTELYRTSHVIETEDELLRCMRRKVMEFPE